MSSRVGGDRCIYIQTFKDHVVLVPTPIEAISIFLMFSIIGEIKMKRRDKLGNVSCCSNNKISRSDDNQNYQDNDILPTSEAGPSKGQAMSYQSSVEDIESELEAEESPYEEEEGSDESNDEVVVEEVSIWDHEAEEEAYGNAFNSITIATEGKEILIDIV